MEHWDHTSALISSVYGAFTGQEIDPCVINPYRVEQQGAGGYDPGVWFDKNVGKSNAVQTHSKFD